MLEENELYDKALKIANGEIKYKETMFLISEFKELRLQLFYPKSLEQLFHLFISLEKKLAV